MPGSGSGSGGSPSPAGKTWNSLALTKWARPRVGPVMLPAGKPPEDVPAGLTGSGPPLGPCGSSTGRPRSRWCPATGHRRNGSGQPPRAGRRGRRRPCCSTPDAVLQVANGILDLGVAAVVSLQFEHLPVPVGDEAVIAVGGEEGHLGTGRGPHPPDDEPYRCDAGLSPEGSTLYRWIRAKSERSL